MKKLLIVFLAMSFVSPGIRRTVIATAITGTMAAIMMAAGGCSRHVVGGAIFMTSHGRSRPLFTFSLHPCMRQMASRW